MYGILVNEMQNDWILENSALNIGEAGRAIIPRIQRLLEVAREGKVPVIYSNLNCIKDDPLFKPFPPHAIPGTPGVEVVDELKPNDGDYIVNSFRLDAFLYSNLEFVLRVAGVDTIAITGTTTDGALLLTAMHAFQSGFKVIMVSDCCGTWNEQRHQMGLNYLKPFTQILNSDEVIELLRK